MLNLKSELSILAECANRDLPNTEGVIKEASVISEYKDIEESSNFYQASAEIVPVIKYENEYYTEASFMYPFMRDAGITNFEEALNIIAEANNLPEKSVGLLIESECNVTEMLEKACGKQKEGILKKAEKATKVAKDLKEKGFPIKRKKNKK